MENKPRKIRLCRYHIGSTSYPSLVLKGRYVRDFGFGIGDQVTITNPTPGQMTIQVTRTNDEINGGIKH